MPDHLFEQLLSRLDRDGALSCACGRTHRIELREILLGEDALGRSASLLRARHGRPALWVLSDENTEAAAGARWKSLLDATRVASRILPGRPRPVPTLSLAAELALEVRALAPDLLVAVGSGVVSDLVKRVSLDTGLPSWCVATAPSVDAYTSATAALRVEGYHVALPARASEVVVCDLEVMAAAPPLLFLAGLGDLLAKFLAQLDWSLSGLMTGEHRCEALGALALASARRALAAARERARDPLAAARWLADAVLVSGLAMQAYGSSRPAASAEHTLAHHWETAGAVEREEHDLHGLLVGAASRLLLPGYLGFHGALAGGAPDAAARLAAHDREPPWEARLEPALQPFAARMAQELAGRRFDRAVLARRLEAFAAGREQLAAQARPLLAELAEAVETVAGLGFPFGIAIAAPHRLAPLPWLRCLRNRYTTFDLAYELGREPELLGPILAQA